MESNTAYLGYMRFISQAEIDNASDYLREEGRDGNKPVYTIDNLEGITYDSVNYLNGHHENNGGSQSI